MKMLMAQLRRALAERDHARLDAHSLQLRAVELVRAPRELLEVDVGPHRHFARVDLEDARARGLVRQWELDLPVETAGPEQCRIEDINTVRGRNDLHSRVSVL